MDEERIDYILQHSSYLMTSEESLAWKHYASLYKQGANDLEELSPERKEVYLKKGWVTQDHRILRLLKDGIGEFRRRTAERILKEHGEEVVFNYCPKCGKLTRTPKAKQCRFCFFSWH